MAGSCCSTARPTSAGKPRSKANWKVADGVDLGQRGREGPALHDQRVRRLRIEGRLSRAAGHQQRRVPAHTPAADQSGRRLLRAEHRRAGRQPVSHRQLRQPPEGRRHVRHRRLAHVRRARRRGPLHRRARWQVGARLLDPKPLGRGCIGLQFNSGLVEFRNVKLKPLGLKDIFNGQGSDRLEGVSRQAEQFAVTPEGEFERHQRPGQLEWQGDASPTSSCNSTSFPTASTSTRASSSAASPANCGRLREPDSKRLPGRRSHAADRLAARAAFYRRQNARRVVSNDFEWFKKTARRQRRSHGHLGQRLPGERLDRQAAAQGQSPARPTARSRHDHHSRSRSDHRPVVPEPPSRPKCPAARRKRRARNNSQALVAGSKLLSLVVRRRG